MLQGHTCQEDSVCGAEPRSTVDVEVRCGLYPMELPAFRPTPHKAVFGTSLAHTADDPPSGIPPGKCA